MRLVVVVVFFHRRACLLGSQTTNRFFNYPRDIPPTPPPIDLVQIGANWCKLVQIGAN